MKVAKKEKSIDIRDVKSNDQGMNSVQNLGISNMGTQYNNQECTILN